MNEAAETTLPEPKEETLAPLTVEQLEQLTDAFHILREKGVIVALVGHHDAVAVEIRERVIGPDSLRVVLAICDTYELSPYVLASETGPIILQPARLISGVLADTPPAAFEPGADTETAETPTAPYFVDEDEAGFTISIPVNGQGDEYLVVADRLDVPNDARLRKIGGEVAEQIAQRALAQSERGVAVADALTLELVGARSTLARNLRAAETDA